MQNDKVVAYLEEQKSAREKQYDILVDIYEQLGGDKKQTSLNESLVAKLTSNGDINKAVQGLTPTEMKQAITSGILTTDSNGNYAIDYSRRHRVSYVGRYLPAQTSFQALLYAKQDCSVHIGAFNCNTCRFLFLL